MKNIFKILIPSLFILSSCEKNIDLFPQSNLTTSNYFTNTLEIQTALTGCYTGLQAPLLEEWKMSELRSDNSIMGSASSKSAPNKDLSDLDLFTPPTSHQGVYNYWSTNYYNIRNINVLLNALNVNYDETTGVVTKDANSVEISANDLKKFSSEAATLRAYHYFNLVRLFGGVFLIHEPVQPIAALAINRSNVADVYKLIIADLQYAIANSPSLTFATIPSADFGRMNIWTAKALLAKVYLTLNRKTDAIPLLNDIISNSGYGLLPIYSDIFSIGNEMNKEILFAVRYKAGGLGLGSPFQNLFAPELSGAAIVNGDGSGFNNGTYELETSYASTDVRKAVNIAIWPTATTAVTSNSRRVYPKKFITPVTTVNDGEGDWIVIRYADILLMLAEAQGNTASSLALINQIRTRAGNSTIPLTALNVPNDQRFADSLSKERRIEFAFENVRWYDLLRFNVTMPLQSQDAVARLKANYAFMFPYHYSKYPSPAPTLATIQGFVTNDKLLLPIPQREIDNNTKLVIPQNPGY